MLYENGVEQEPDDDAGILNWSINKCKGEFQSIKYREVVDTLNQHSDESPTLLSYCCTTAGIKKKKGEEKKEHKLSQLPATAISGNDLLSSCLYVTGLCSQYAGIWSPLCLLLVDVLLYFYKSIYSEVGSAIALNGASYTLLLNTTSKKTASLAACLTMISYVATAVVSASTAIFYIKLLPHCENVPVFWGCVIILAIFAVLNLIGISESAISAFIIFAFHTACLVALILTCFGYAVWYDRFETLKYNWHNQPKVSIPKSIFFGFGAGMLGVTGFETSANFIEQQAPGVFPKTLRNMWVLVTLFNPVIAFLSLCVMPLSEIQNPATNSNLLSQMGMKSGGRWFQILLSVDAATVLSGSVLTSYVGITGLLRQMALDRCFPAIFLQTNKLRGTNHWIIITFFLVCVSMSAALGEGQLNALAGVYAIAFLSVMSLFALGDLLLKYKRGRIRRGPHASKTFIVLAVTGTAIALAANIINNPDYLAYFFAYYVICALLVLSMLWRVKIIKFVIYLVYSKFKRVKIAMRLIQFLVKHAQEINSQSVIYFCKDDTLGQLNKAILYIRENELTSWIRIVHVYSKEQLEQTDSELEIKLDQMKKHVETLDVMYQKIRIDFVALEMERFVASGTAFGPEVVDSMESYFGIRKNLMFISCPSEKFRYKVADLNGARIITSD